MTAVLEGQRVELTIDLPPGLPLSDPAVHLLTETAQADVMRLVLLAREPASELVRERDVAAAIASIKPGPRAERLKTAFDWARLAFSLSLGFTCAQLAQAGGTVSAPGIVGAIATVVFGTAAVTLEIIMKRRR